MRGAKGAKTRDERRPGSGGPRPAGSNDPSVITAVRTGYAAAARPHGECRGFSFLLRILLHPGCNYVVVVQVAGIVPWMYHVLQSTACCVCA